jgi:hypothetical protein
MTLLWITIGILLLIVAVITVVDIVRRHLGGARTSAWILIVVLLPVIGSIAYWLQRKPTTGEVEQYAAADRDVREQARRRPVGPQG